MKQYRIKTLEKKNVNQSEIWTHEERELSVVIVQLYRWGEFVVQCEEDEHFDLENKQGLWVTDYDIQDQNMDDGISLYFTNLYSNTKELTEEEKESIIEELEQIYEEGAYIALEEAGWSFDDVETFVMGPLEVEDITNE